VIKTKRQEKLWATKFYNRFVLRLGRTNLSWEKPSHSDKYWTSAMMRLLGMMAKTYGLRPYSHLHCGEYMVDMCWYKETKKKEFADTVIEEEWSDDNDLSWDFNKLVDFKAYLKVFIFSPNSQKITRWINIFKKIIKKNPIKLDEEIYLIITLEKDENDLTRVTGYIIDKYGNAEHLNTKVC
jgi:hypothetical protein